MEDIVADPDALRFTRIPEPPPPGFAATWLGRYRDNEERVGFAIEEDGDFLGLALAPEIDREGRQVELGYIVHPARAQSRRRHARRWCCSRAGRSRSSARCAPTCTSTSRTFLLCVSRSGPDTSARALLRSLHLKQDLRGDAELWSRLPGDPEPVGR